MVVLGSVCDGTTLGCYQILLSFDNLACIALAEENDGRNRKTMFVALLHATHGLRRLIWSFLALLHATHDLFGVSHYPLHSSACALCRGKEIVLAENLHAKQCCSFLLNTNITMCPLLLRRLSRRNRNLHPALGGGSIKNLWTPHTL